MVSRLPEIRFAKIRQFKGVTQIWGRFNIWSFRVDPKKLEEKKNYQFIFVFLLIMKLLNMIKEKPCCNKISLLNKANYKIHIFDYTSNDFRYFKLF